MSLRVTVRNESRTSEDSQELLRSLNEDSWMRLGSAYLVVTYTSCSPARVSELCGNLSKAIFCYLQAIHLNPNCYRAYVQLGYLQKSTENPAQACVLGLLKPDRNLRLPKRLSEHCAWTLHHWRPTAGLPTVNSYSTKARNRCTQSRQL